LPASCSAKLLAVAQYPEIAPPTVQILTTYPGASAETLARTVAAPIEEQLSGVEKLSYFSSTSSSTGSLTITATFEPGTNVDQSVFNVNNRVQIALPRLPDEVRRNGVIVQKRSFDILLVVSLFSPNKTRDTLFLSNYSSINLVDELKRVPGIADVTIFGARDYSMRVWLNTDKMAQLGVTTSEVAAALRVQNAQYAAGRIGTEPAPPGQNLVYTVTATGRLVEPEQFGEIVVRARDATAGPSGARSGPEAEGHRADRARRAQLRHLQHARRPAHHRHGHLPAARRQRARGRGLVRDKMKELRPAFPQDVEYSIPFDTTRFVDASIKEVNTTIFEAALLVLAVVFLFLQTWRATLIPDDRGAGVADRRLRRPVAGRVLDQHPHALRAGARHRHRGRRRHRGAGERRAPDARDNMPPFEAALEAMREVSGAVVAIVLVLCAVFVPVAFLGGIAGQLYRQFAVTLTFAVVISGFIALTLTPALCALLMQKGGHHGGRLAFMFEPFNRVFAWSTGASSAAWSGCSRTRCSRSSVSFR
jgi:multidrug efflux pump subunit AcrB